jgi:mono/diheme cytochrome c family protein
MSSRQQLYLLFFAIMLCAGIAVAQDVNSQRGVVNFATPILPDPLLQHSREIYILNGCVYCHGVDLMVRNGEAADLLHSNLIGRDENGNLIRPLLRAGIPQTPMLSPMPQFADLSDSEIADIVRWIHYARQRGRYKEIMEMKNSVPGDSATGKTYFEQKCVSCHSTEGDFAKIGKKYHGEMLKAHILRPEFLDAAHSWKVDQPHDAKIATARQRHFALLENYSASDVADLVAYLQNLK